MKTILPTVVALVLAFVVYTILPKDAIFKKFDEFWPLP